MTIAIPQGARPLTAPAPGARSVLVVGAGATLALFAGLRALVAKV